MAKPHRKPSVSPSVWFYRRQLLTSPAHALVVLLPVTLWLFTLNLGVALAAFVIIEGLMFAVAPYVPAARRAIDARVDQQAREAAAATRAQLLSRMSEEHRRTFGELETTASLIRRSVGGGTPVGDCLGLESLLAAYVRLAVAHRAACESLPASDAVRRFENELAILEARPRDASPATQTSIDRRVAVLRARFEAQRAARDEQAALQCDLATIADTVGWMRENCMAARSESVRHEVMRTVDVACNDGALLRDLSRLNEPVPFDPRVLELGRGVRTVPAPPPPMAVRVVVDPTVQGRSPTLSEPIAIEPALMAVSRG